MKTLYLLAIIFIVLNISSCVNTSSCKSSTCIKNHTIVNKSSTKPVRNLSKYKNPLAVNIYEAGNKPNCKYQVIAKETISIFNNSGIKRQEASIKDTMRSVAALMGGDAIIDVQADKKYVTATIVAMQDTV